MAVVEDHQRWPRGRNGPARPGRRARRRRRPGGQGGTQGRTGGPRHPGKRSPIVIELAVIAFLGWIYDWLQSLAPLRVNLAFKHARAVLSFERRLGIAPEHALNHWLAHQHVLAYIASDFYDNAIFGVTLGLAAWIGGAGRTSTGRCATTWSWPTS